MRFPHFFHHRRPEPTGDPAPPRPVHPSAWRPRLTLRAEAEAMADELEAWLNGGLATYRAQDIAEFPPWLIVNRLAHAGPDALAALARGEEPDPVAPFRRLPTWAAAEQGLVRQLVGDGHDPDRVTTLQRGALVPLELRLIEQAKREPLSLGQVVAAVAKALGQQHHPG